LELSCLTKRTDRPLFTPPESAPAPVAEVPFLRSEDAADSGFAKKPISARKRATYAASPLRNVGPLFRVPLASSLGGFYGRRRPCCSYPQ
jgi:hypothetical protein